MLIVYIPAAPREAAMRTRAQVWHHDHGCPVNARHVATTPDGAMPDRRINEYDAQRGISRAAGFRCPSFAPSPSSFTSGLRPGPTFLTR